MHKYYVTWLQVVEEEDSMTIEANSVKEAERLVVEKLQQRYQNFEITGFYDVEVAKCSSIMKPSDILQSAHDLIDSPEKWTQGSSAKNVAGQYTLSESTTAVRWCAIGALRKMSSIESISYIEAREYLAADAKRFGYDSIVQANDDPNTTWDQVRRAFRRSIKKAKKDGK